MTDVLSLRFAALNAAPRDTFEMIAAFQANNLRLCQEADVGALFDATNEVSRHRVGKARPSDEHVHALRASTQKYRSLAC